MESKVKLTGSKKKGYFIEIDDHLGMYFEYAITEDELLQLQTLLNKKFGHEFLVEKYLKK